ncbi:hypothetical protein DFH28DRAFT_885952 [Melampsora americana]|nr:hypothetical protein DFH28DRAFT_885952 [Melampsora americana]
MQVQSLCNLPENALRRAYDKLTKVQSGAYELEQAGSPETKIATHDRPIGSQKDRSKDKSILRDPSSFEYLAHPKPKAHRKQKKHAKSKAHAKTKAPRKCSKCKEPGHTKNMCPLVSRQQDPTLEELQLDQDENTQNDDSSSEFSLTLRQIPEELDHDSNSQDGNDDNAPICPFCNDPLPSQLSEKLQSLLESLLKRSHRVSLSMSDTIAFCAMHNAETVYVPIGIENGWPLSIHFDDLSERVEKYIPDLKQIINHQIESTYLNGALHILQRYGARQMDSVWHGDLTFHLEQPGYYGGRGLEIIYRTLHWHFLRHQAPDQLQSIKSAPLSPDSWVRTVMIPEVSLRLIAEDLKVSILDPKAKNTLESSRAYGMAMFPVKDDNF